MTKIFWLSRHPLTSAQKATLDSAGLTGDIQQSDMVFGSDPIAQVKSLGIEVGATIAVVAPLEVALALLRSGYILATFSNTPSARAKGVFLCKGVWLHTLQDSTWTGCPVPVEEQEA